MVSLGGAGEVMLFVGLALALLATVLYVRSGLRAVGAGPIASSSA
jgi:hypothetical protein